MRVLIATLADYASISLGDKLNILGIFSNIVAPQEPIVHPQMQLVVQLEFQPSEAGKKDVRVVLNDEDGRELLSLGGEMQVPRPPHSQAFTVNQIFVFNGVTFPKFGEYEFQIMLNGEVRAQVPVQIVKANLPPPS